MMKCIRHSGRHTVNTVQCKRIKAKESINNQSIIVYLPNDKLHKYKYSRLPESCRAHQAGHLL